MPLLGTAQGLVLSPSQDNKRILWGEGLREFYSLLEQPQPHKDQTSPRKQTRLGEADSLHQQFLPSIRRTEASKMPAKCLGPEQSQLDQVVLKM
jgi:hypothetical protein